MTTSHRMTTGQAVFATVNARAIRSGEFDLVTLAGAEVFAGTAHSALAVAKDLLANPHDGEVAIVTAAGATITADRIRTARF